MNTSSRIIGNHAYFVREGDAFALPAPGVTGRNTKPEAADAAWLDLGVLMDVGYNPSSEEREIYAPTPGQIRLYDVIETKAKTQIKITTQELSALVWELIFKTLPLAVNGANQQYNPLAVMTHKGWLKVQQYDQNDALFNTVDTYCQIKVDGEVKFSDDIVKANLTALVLHSIYNTGSLV